MPRQPPSRVVRGRRAAQGRPQRATARPANPVAERQAQPAARRRQPGDLLNQPVDRVRVQVDEQALGDPRGRPARVEARGRQPGRPVRPQVTRHRDALAAGPGLLRGQHLFLDTEHVRGVQLVTAHARRPGQPEGTGVEPGAEQHHLPRPGRASLPEHLVEEHGARHHPGPQRVRVPPARLAGLVPGRRSGLDSRRRPGGAQRREGRGQRIIEQPVRPGALPRPDRGDRQPGPAHPVQRDGDIRRIGHDAHPKTSPSSAVIVVD